MKVIFLDVDDVLNCITTTDKILKPDGTPSWIPDYEGKEAWVGLDEDKLELIRNIIKETRAKIVLSTSWRTDAIATMYLKERLGLETANQIIGQTPYSRCTNPRADEIDEWLAEHKEVTKFIVIDNLEKDDLQRFGRSYIQTNPMKGLTPELATKCIEILGKE